MIALAIDLAVLAAVFGGVYLAVSLTSLKLGGVSSGIALFAAIVVRLLYPALFESRWRGRTPGKAAMGLRVMVVGGGPVRFRHAIIRSVIGLIELEATGGLLAFFSSLASRSGQRLGDRAAGAIVVRERTAARVATPVRFGLPPELAAYAGTLEVARLSSAHYEAARSFLMRAPSLAPAVRHRLAEQLAGPIAASIGHTPQGGTTAEGFLVALVGAVQQPRPSSAADAVVTPAPLPRSNSDDPSGAAVDQGGFVPPT